MAKLVVYTNQNTGREYHLDDRIQIGRSPACAARISEEGVSREHAVIQKRGSTYVVRDLESRNGTFVNGDRVRERVLLDGDEIGIGSARLLFVDRDIDPWIGKSVKGYKILEQLGSGGMGVVYKAKQLSMQRDVALKLLNPECMNKQEHVKQFINEARTAGRLNHPNLVQVFEVGEEDGVYFFSMEYIDGINVNTKLSQSGKLPTDEALRIILEVSHALKHAHDSGIVHQDIKPHNIMISPGGQVKLADLGIARAIGREMPKRKKKQVLGTPHYMSPEQARRQKVDMRSDIYSLGATMYHMITGRTPFSGDSALAVIAKHMNQPLTSPRKFDVTIPQKVSDIVCRMMCKDPADRYQDVAEVIAVLESCRGMESRFSSNAIAERKRAITTRKQNRSVNIKRVRRPRRRARDPVSTYMGYGLAVVACVVAVIMLPRLLNRPAPQRTPPLGPNVQRDASPRAPDALRDGTGLSDPDLQAFLTLKHDVERDAQAGEFRRAHERLTAFRSGALSPVAAGQVDDAMQALRTQANAVMSVKLARAIEKRDRGDSRGALALLREIIRRDFDERRVQRAKDLAHHIVTRDFQADRAMMMQAVAGFRAVSDIPIQSLLAKYGETESGAECRMLSEMIRAQENFLNLLLESMQSAPGRELDFLPGQRRAPSDPVMVEGADAGGIRTRSGGLRQETAWSAIPEDQFRKIFLLYFKRLGPDYFLALGAKMWAEGKRDRAREMLVKAGDFASATGTAYGWLTCMGMPINKFRWTFDGFSIGDGCEVAAGQWELRKPYLVNRGGGEEAVLRFTAPAGEIRNFMASVRVRLETEDASFSICGVRSGPNPEYFGAGYDGGSLQTFMHFLGAGGSRVVQSQFLPQLDTDYQMDLLKDGAEMTVTLDGVSVGQFQSEPLDAFQGWFEIRVDTGVIAVEEVRLQLFNAREFHGEHSTSPAHAVEYPDMSATSMKMAR